MRRMWAAGTAMVVCLALGGMPVVAQSPAQGAAWVTGTIACTVTEEGTVTDEAGVERIRGRAGECTWASSDPRLSGPFTMSGDIDCPASVAGGNRPCVMWYTIDATGWTGVLYGTRDASGQENDFVIQTGRGPNSGLVFLGPASPPDFSGLIYEGTPPTFRPLPSPAGE